MLYLSIERVFVDGPRTLADCTKALPQAGFCVLRSSVYNFVDKLLKSFLDNPSHLHNRLNGFIFVPIAETLQGYN